MNAIVASYDYLDGYMPSCDHDDAELRTHVHSDGRPFIKLECQVCGKRGNAMPQAHPAVRDLAEDPPPIDETISERWWSEITAKRQAEWDAQRSQYRNEYLNSPEWRKRSAMVLFRDRGLCQAKLDDCEHIATDVHHRTYDNVRNEPLYDLVAVCRSCHERIEAKRRGEDAA